MAQVVQEIVYLFKGKCYFICFGVKKFQSYGALGKHATQKSDYKFIIAGINGLSSRHRTTK